MIPQNAVISRNVTLHKDMEKNSLLFKRCYTRHTIKLGTVFEEPKVTGYSRNHNATRVPSVLLIVLQIQTYIIFISIYIEHIPFQLL